MKRYVNETRRLFSVLETRLADRKWLVGDRYSLADIKTFVGYSPLFHLLSAKS